MTRSQALDVANALIKRCQSTNLMATATPKGSKGSLGRGERANLTIQGQLRAFREAVSMRYKIEIGPGHVLMGWMVRYCACFVNNFQVKGTGRTCLHVCHLATHPCAGLSDSTDCQHTNSRTANPRHFRLDTSHIVSSLLLSSQQKEFVGAVKLADKNTTHPPHVQFGSIL